MRLSTAQSAHFRVLWAYNSFVKPLEAFTQTLVHLRRAQALRRWPSRRLRDKQRLQLLRTWYAR